VLSYGPFKDSSFKFNLLNSVLIKYTGYLKFMVLV